MSLSKRPVVLAALLVTLITTACVTGQQADRQDPFEAAGAGTDDILITIENNDFRDANIFAYWDGVRDRIGFVVGKTSRTFRTKWKSERVQLGVDFVGRGAYRTRDEEVWPGDHLNFVILGR